MISSKKETVQQFIKFALVGVTNTAVDVLVYVALTRLIPFFGSHIYIANTISFLVATSWSYGANRTWTFRRDSRASVYEASRFLGVTGSGFVINTLVLFLVVHGLGMYDLVGKGAAVVTSVIWNFFFTKFWVFKENA